MADSFVSAKGKKNDSPVCKVFPKFMRAIDCINAKEASYGRMEPISGGITAVFG
jgi:hypothetical protein